MPINSSTSSSDLSLPTGSRAPFRRRVAQFLAPYMILALVLAVIGSLTGEFLPARTSAWLQSLGYPVLYLPKLTDHSYSYKLAGVEIQRPAIIALGASRANQWRSAMFDQSFYNASQAVYTFKNYSQFIESLGTAKPRVVIASVDFYNFSDAWNEFSGSRALKEDLNPFDVRELPIIELLEDFSQNPLSLVDDFRDPVYGVPAIGLSAQRLGAGFRADGSFQYGPQIVGDTSSTTSLQRALDLIAGGLTPFQFDDTMSEAGFADLAAFLSLADREGITVIAVTMPLQPSVVRALDASPGHGIWRDFRGPRLREWLRQRGVSYFDFSDIASFGGRIDEFVDPYHPSETAYLRILLKMAADSKVASVLGVNSQRLLPWLSEATNLEVFRNSFAAQ